MGWVATYADRAKQRKAEAGYIAPRDRESCARCHHFRVSGVRAEGYCGLMSISVAAGGWCSLCDPIPKNTTADRLVWPVLPEW